MSDWTIHLTFIDAKSKKFWRGKAEGDEFIVNYGRIGTDGQTKVKDMGSAAKADAELEKVANQKRKKGYEDAEGSGEVEDAPVAAPVAKQSVKMTIKRDGRPVQLSLTSDGKTVTTEVVETHANDAAAAAAYARIVEALTAEGYKPA